MSIDTALSIASGGLANIAQQMATVSNNVANASTPGYAEEISTQTSLVGAGQGYGVLTGNVVRQIDLQLQQEIFQQNATVSGLQAQNQGLAPVDAAQGVPGAGSDLGSILGNLQSAFTTLQSDPSNNASQSQAVDAAEALASKLNSLSSAYQTARQTAQQGIQTGLQQLNSDLTTISQLSDQIVAAQAGGQSTAALENQRSAAMADASNLASINFIAQSNGGLIAAIGPGLTMPMTQPAPQFSMANSAINAQTAYPGQGIAGIMLNGADVTQQFASGSIGANLALRDTTLPGYQAQLDEFANTLQSRFAAQGLQLFSPPTGGTSSVTPTPDQNGYIGYAATISVDPSVIANPAEVRDGNLTVAGSPTGAASFTPNPPGGPAGFETLIDNVLTYALGSQAQSGVAQPSPNVSGLGVLGNLNAPYSPPATLAGFASVLASAQSADVSNAAAQLTSETAVQSTLSSQFTATSGVDTDTELSKMVALQNAYSANARIIGAAQSMWEALLTAVPA
jgi:flagellar hook-associated protein 1